MATEEGAGPAEGVQSLRERALAENSLVLLLQGLHGDVTTVELRNESAARGRVVNVDAFMNITMETVLYRDRRGHASSLQHLFIAGRNVRYVHIPEHRDVASTLQQQLSRIQRCRSFSRDGGGRKEFSKKNK